MAWTKYETPEEKRLLQERALILKPKVPGVIATELGWSLPSIRGTMEVLVRYDGLDTLLGDAVSEVEQVGEPLTITPEVVEEVAQEPATEVVVEEPVAPVKKPGRPKKVVE